MDTFREEGESCSSLEARHAHTTFNILHMLGIAWQTFVIYPER